MKRSSWSTVTLRILVAGACLAPWGLNSASTAQPPAAGKAPPVFEQAVLPILQAKCLNCHGDKKQRAGLDLRTKAALIHGGESGPALKPGYLADSPLWEKVITDKMPTGGDKLSAAEKEIIRRWIETGAHGDDKAVAANSVDRQVSDEDRRFWAFQKPTRPAIPVVKDQARVRNPVDAFVLAALEKKGLSLSAEADPLTLLRRLYLDLIGLPPTAEEIDAFLKASAGAASAAPQTAWDQAVERLLNSPRYGERWGRHWLDVAGYADSEGILDADYVRSAAWRYRDYVIRAFNQDKPYDRFLQEQIAGDELIDYWAAYETQKELPASVIDALVATGYLRCASDTSRPDFAQIKNAPGYYFQTLDDTLKIVASSTMGLTVQCAKCHSHKYDPIPQTDYYRLQAIFMSGYRPSQWIPQVQRRLLEASAVQEQEAKAHNAKIDAVIAGIKKQQQQLQQVHAAKLFDAELAKLPMQIRDDVKGALTIDAAKRNEVQKYLAAKFEADLKPAGPALTKKLQADPEYKAKEQPLTQAIQKEEANKRNFAEIRAFYDLPGEAKTQLLRRGDYLQPGPEMTPGVLSVLATPQAFTAPPRAKEAKTSGRRLAFARWLTQADHPLTARVMVNRVWLHYFGQGLVSTPDNFGRTGSPPSHRELLDWLATEFASPANPKDQAWSIKRLHRLIVTSSAYRQSSAQRPGLHDAAKRIDPENRLLWRQRLRRLEAEVLRDSTLHVAGTINLQMFGQPVPMVRQGDGEVTTPADDSGNRRSIYLQVRRSQPLTFLQLFDQPVIETNCTHRETSTVSSQALTLLNSDFMQRQAEALANRVLKEQPSDAAGRAVLLAFTRAATDQEKALFQGFLEQQTQQHAKALAANQQTEARRRAVADLCHMLLSANEFAYID
jgi:hypothetical protein